MFPLRRLLALIKEAQSHIEIAAVALCPFLRRISLLPPAERPLEIEAGQEIALAQLVLLSLPFQVPVRRRVPQLVGGPGAQALPALDQTFMADVELRAIVDRLTRVGHKEVGAGRAKRVGNRGDLFKRRRGKPGNLPRFRRPANVGGTFAQPTEHDLGDLAPGVA